jgi:hypothetical protein
MDGLAQSVGHGLGSVVGGALNSIAATISSIVNQTSRVVPGGFPIVALVGVVVLVLVFATLIRH